MLDSIFAVDESATHKLNFINLQPSNGSTSQLSGVPSDARLSEVPYMNQRAVSGVQSSSDAGSGSASPYYQWHL